MTLGQFGFGGQGGGGCLRLTARFRRIIGDAVVVSSSQSLESEAPRQSPAAAAPAVSWPQQGKITFHNVEMRYRDNLPHVLRNLSFTILPEETIGIVGRTGSGTCGSFLCSFPKLFPSDSFFSNGAVSVLRLPFSGRKVLPGRRPVQAGGAGRRLHHRRWDQYRAHRPG